METNDTLHVQENGQTEENGQNDTSASNNVSSFPSNGDTQLRDISTLLHGAPVIQQNSAGLTQPGSAIATAEDFSQVEERRPFARKVGPKALFGAGLALLIVVPLAAAFMGGDGNSNDTEQTTEGGNATSAQEGDGVYLSAEDYAAQQAEVEQLRSQQAFINQQVDAEAIDAAGRQQQSRATAQPSSTRSGSRSAASTASRPASTTTAQPSSVTLRAAPAPTRVAAPSSRPTPVTISSRSPAPATSQPSAQSSVRESEPVDPFERRAQLQALGSYGAPPPMAKALQTASYEPSNPFETQYVQAIALSPQPAIATPSKATQAISPVKRPLTPEELQYEQDAAAVLATEPPVDESPVAAVEGEPLTEASSVQPQSTPMAIMPGTTAAAELPNGFSWQEGMPLPEVLLLTTEDIMAGEVAVIPAGTQFLAQAQIDPGSGAVAIQIVGLFSEIRNIQIPRSSVIVQAEDGSILTASASGGPSRAAGSNMGGFFMESLRNGVSNVIGSDDSLVTDIAGGMAETLIDNQIEQAQANAAARDSRTAAQPLVWTLNSRPRAPDV